MIPNEMWIDSSTKQIKIFFEGDEKKAESRLDLIDQVKDLLGLSANPRLLGFIADLPEEQLLAACAEGGEITAARLPKSSGSFRESVLQYHRPLLEDGELEYEFYFEPGKTYRTGDYWSVAARTATGNVEWPTDAARRPHW